MVKKNKEEIIIDWHHVMITNVLHFKKCGKIHKRFK